MDEGIIIKLLESLRWIPPDQTIFFEKSAVWGCFGGQNEVMRECNRKTQKIGKNHNGGTYQQNYYTVAMETGSAYIWKTINAGRL